MEERYKSFTVLISGISRSIRRIKTEEMAEFNLKSPHVSCLYYLLKEENLTSGELCAICEEDKANVSRSLKYLEQEGYIIIDAYRNKHYRNMIKLTDKGREVAEKLAQKIDSMLERASEGLSEEDRVIMYRSLSLISSNLQKIYETYEASGADEVDPDEE